MEAYLRDEIVEGDCDPSLKGSLIGELVEEAIMFNSTSQYIKDNQLADEIGEKAERSLYNYLSKSGFDVKTKLEERRSNIDTLFSIPFSPKRKRSTTVIKHPSQAGKVRVFCKGAPEMVIKYCDYFLDGSGNVERL